MKWEVVVRFSSRQQRVGVYATKREAQAIADNYSRFSGQPAYVRRFTPRKEPTNG